MRLIKMSLLTVLLGVAAFSQNAISETSPTPTATVYIYRLRAFSGGGKGVTLSLDGEPFGLPSERADIGL